MRQRSKDIAAMKPREPGRGKQRVGTSGQASVAVTRGSRHPALLLGLLGLLRLPAAGGDCGPPPRVTHAKPSGANLTSSFPVGSKVTYTCLEGTIKLPGRSDTVECLPGPRWSELSELCDRKYFLSLHQSSLLRLLLRLKFLPFVVAVLQWHFASWRGTKMFPLAAVHESC
ncbi:complement decay-accelerating factor, GPI-anchored-like [Apteryx rowi]|uniref:complement decay-accelerating factor, GPI-anchored-like n=1 Tax=Apteryx rowi TaxID=308060 RepID=UPI000E1D572B|nr:complement decay-accelerating factor, GPI-anchored-like [Apteryx rowi]